MKDFFQRCRFYACQLGELQHTTFSSIECIIIFLVGFIIQTTPFRPLRFIHKSISLFFSTKAYISLFWFFQKINAHLALLYTYLSWYVGTRLPTFSFPFLTNKCNQFPVSNRILQMPFDILPKKVATESEKKSEQTLCNDEHQVLVTNSSASVAAPRF